ncbi:hypothetical protein TNCV_4282261 [Trichonephila clavipes]|nr:hypothetical protein TNCV_4282261 [Trichonephila clavipes]
MVLEERGRDAITLPRTSQTCSIGLRSGDLAVAPRPHPYTSHQSQSLFQRHGEVCIQVTRELKSCSPSVTPRYNRQMTIFSGRRGSWTTFPRLTLDGSNTLEQFP